jgi:hypothetical protein
MAAVMRLIDLGQLLEFEQRRQRALFFQPDRGHARHVIPPAFVRCLESLRRKATGFSSLADAITTKGQFIDF